MSKRYLLIAAACVLGAAGLAQAQSAGAPSAADTVKLRQTAFALSASDFGAMRHLADGPGEVKDLAFNANALRRWAHVLPTAFPAGTGPEAGVPTRAKTEVWSDRAGFEKAAAAYATEADKLFELAKANDKAGFTAQLKVVDETCDSCHKVYRARPPQAK
ncbi:MAG: cytochrome c [Proteobacteria bacterium]|nr:cytochrome c [Pseudomonadota bacterium]